ncbi:MAG: helix-turn-helix transcriptional regulator [Candidatus Bathyarchaeota archaeon]|nr:helix-turn-helix transcriptional regulator [Candidatus Termiticorpusculum sp.]
MQTEKKATDWIKETQKGYIRIAILILLNKKPHHGYEIMKTLNEKTNGIWKPTSGGIYPILQNLENSKYIKGTWDLDTKRKRKTYSITTEGKKILEHILTKENRLFNTITELLKEYMTDILYMKVNNNLHKTPLTRFLEEDTYNPKDTKKILENKKTHIEDIIKKMQEKLEQINKQLTQIQKEENKK